MLKAIENLSTNQHTTKHADNEKKVEQGVFNSVKDVGVQVNNNNENYQSSDLQAIEREKIQSPIAKAHTSQPLNSTEEYSKTEKRLIDINDTQKDPSNSLEKPSTDLVERDIAYEKLEHEVTHKELIDVKNCSTDQEVNI